MIVLDTSAVIDHLDGRAKAKAVLQRELARGPLLVPAVAAWELWSGAEGSADDAVLDQLFGEMTIDPMTSEIAHLAATLHREHRAAGIERPALDLIIAAHAIYHGCPLATADKGFARVRGLEVIAVR